MTTPPQSDQPEWNTQARIQRGLSAIGPVCPRANLAWVEPAFPPLSSLRKGGRLGASSARRRSQLRARSGFVRAPGRVFAVTRRRTIEPARGDDLCIQNSRRFRYCTAFKGSGSALRTTGEVSVALSSAGKLAYLFPILNGARIAAILFATAEEAEVDQLELVANMAGSALEHKGQPSLQIALLPKVEAPPPQPAAAAPSPPRRLPPWADMPADQRALHSEAAGSLVSLLPRWNS